MNTQTNNIEHELHSVYKMHDVQVNEEQGNTVVTTANLLLIDYIEAALSNMGYKFKNIGNCAGLKFVIES